ncbi:hypothetical protein HAT2_00074 [Candidatus Similichlamydia laticola]|uniref:Uncharacterized protein n=1 Tax=Candidatus Similichlamydia laticola TaxID=2170265 RepID=A0A369KJ79_9BACT|nr:hypothetical protein HAT2_00077 [Candidatus Similichlamydia laticola]RDB31817.1 hypothetical protein HAT2_00074 [Candidatus Similichlamydia laticola]
MTPYPLFKASSLFRSNNLFREVSKSTSDFLLGEKGLLLALKSI